MDHTASGTVSSPPTATTGASPPPATPPASPFAHAMFALVAAVVGSASTAATQFLFLSEPLARVVRTGEFRPMVVVLMVAAVPILAGVGLTAAGVYSTIRTWFPDFNKPWAGAIAVALAVVLAAELFGLNFGLAIINSN